MCHVPVYNTRQRAYHAPTHDRDPDPLDELVGDHALERRPPVRPVGRRGAVGKQHKFQVRSAHEHQNQRVIAVIADQRHAPHDHSG
jgi:hypothetical protein